MIVNDDNRTIDVSKELNKLNDYSLEIGIFGEDDSFIAMLADVHEFGVTIKPRGRFLTIPLKKKYRNKKPRDFDLFFMQTKEGHKFLVKNVGKDKIEFAYMLAEQVVIPERSFVRSTFDEKEKSWSDFFDKQVQNIIIGKMTAEEVYSLLGNKVVTDIQRQIRNMSNPKNAPSTVSSKGHNNPLIDTGRLRQSVTWKVVRSSG